MEGYKDLNNFKDKLETVAVVARYGGAVLLSLGVTLDIVAGINLAQSNPDSVRDALVLGSAIVFDSFGLGSMHMAGAADRRADVLRTEILRREYEDKKWSLDTVSTEDKG